MQAPVFILNPNAKREHGRKTQLGIINVAKSVADIMRTTLGPRAMLKMILDPMGGIVMTNDGHAILREIDVSHPAAKNLIELSRTQDEEVGDGTTSVIILTGELLSVAQPLLIRNLHPRAIVGAYIKALDEALVVLDRVCINLDVNNREQMLSIVRSSLGTKFVSRFGDLVCSMALDAVTKIKVEAKGEEKGQKPEIDIKRFARVEKIPGGMLEDSKVLNGIMLNKDVVDAAMPRRIEKPRIILLDCPLEYKKGENQTHVDIKGEGDFEAILKAEEEYVENQCKDIIKLRPNLVFTEKGVSDLAAFYLGKAGISVVRRLRSMDNGRIARAVGAKVVNETSLLTEADVGTGCGLFEIRKIGDEYFTFLDECKDPKACTVLLRGGSKDVLNEIERNLMDAMNVVRNVLYDPRVVPGGGAIEMAIATSITAKTMEATLAYPFKAVAGALEIIPKTLIENCGANTIRLLTDLRAKHSTTDGAYFGIDGNRGVIADMRELKVFDSFLVKSQAIKTSIEAACMLLRIDDIVSGMSKKGGGGGGPSMSPEEQEETFGDARDG